MSDATAGSAIAAPTATRAAWADWHVHPVVDLLAYHFSWLWVMVPLVWAGSDSSRVWFWVWAIGMTAGFAHRHFTMPYVYLDSQVFWQHPARFVLVPVWLIAACVATPLVWSIKAPIGSISAIDLMALAAWVLLVVQWYVADRRGHVWSLPALIPAMLGPAILVGCGWAGLISLHHAGWAVASLGLTTLGSAGLAWDVSRKGTPTAWRATILFGVAAVVAAVMAWTHLGFGWFPTTPLKLKTAVSVVAVIGGAWNIWHVYAQKFGIFRMYAAKSAVPVADRVPPWVDRWFVFGWVPLYFVVLPAVAKPLIKEHFSSTAPLLNPVIDVLVALMPLTLPVALVFLGGSLFSFFWYEYKASGLRHIPRLSMAIGTTGLSASFLLVSPVIAYFAYGFSHAVEYVVFVWAFQRRRYGQELPHQPILSRVLQTPLRAIVWYASLALIIAGTGFFLDFGDDVGWVQAPFKLAGTPASRWLFFWTIWHSLAHFYFDGFLWKMRLPTVRASL